MKYFLSTIAILCSLLSVATAHAQIASCSTVSSDNFDQCCNPPASQDQKNICDDYVFGTHTATPAAAASTPQPATTAANSCSTITPDNFPSCCKSGAETSADCYTYVYGTPAPGQLNSGSGTLSTAPVNNGSYSASGSSINLTDNINLTNSISLADQKAVATCSAIKFDNLLNIAIWAKCIIGTIIIPGIFMLAFVVFLWGVFKFIRATADADKKEGKQFIYMGLIGLFVMTSVWGIIKIVGSTLGIDSTVPTLQTDYLSTDKATK